MMFRSALRRIKGLDTEGPRHFVVHGLHVVHNATLDLRYGPPLACPLNSDRRALAQIFNGRIHADDVLVDIGCGKGRVLNWWLHNTRDNRIVGLELDPKIARSTARRLRRQTRVQILPGDALEALPSAGTVFYLFNPADLAFIDSLEARLRVMSNVRSVLYYNPKHLSAFSASQHWDVTRSHLEGSRHAPYSDLAVIVPSAESARSGAPTVAAHLDTSRPTASSRSDLERHPTGSSPAGFA